VLKLRCLLASERKIFRQVLSSTPNCHWPLGWDLAGERARPGGRFRRRAVPSAVRRGIFVEPKTKIIFSPVGAASSIRTPDDVAPDGALSVGGCETTNMSALTGLEKSVFHPCFICGLKSQPPFAPFVHPKLPLAGAGARPLIGTLLGSAPVPVAVFGVAPLPLKIAQPFMAGTRCPQSSQVPPGTKEFFCRPSRDFYI